jgi:hypothetical protein
MARFLAITRYLIIVSIMSLGLAKASHAPEQEVIEQRKGQGSVAPDFDE